jgi:hypothetical protein
MYPLIGNGWMMFAFGCHVPAARLSQEDPDGLKAELLPVEVPFQRESN